MAESKYQNNEEKMTTIKTTGTTGARPVLPALRHFKYEHLVAGVSGGVISTLLLHPLDLIKIRFAGKFYFIILIHFITIHLLFFFNYFIIFLFIFSPTHFQFMIVLFLYN